MFFPSFCCRSMFHFHHDAIEKFVLLIDLQFVVWDCHWCPLLLQNVVCGLRRASMQAELCSVSTDRQFLVQSGILVQVRIPWLTSQAWSNNQGIRDCRWMTDGRRSQVISRPCRSHAVWLEANLGQCCLWRVGSPQAHPVVWREQSGLIVQQRSRRKGMAWLKKVLSSFQASAHRRQTKFVPRICLILRARFATSSIFPL